MILSKHLYKFDIGWNFYNYYRFYVIEQKGFDSFIAYDDDGLCGISYIGNGYDRLTLITDIFNV